MSENELEQPYPRPLSGAQVSAYPSALIPARTPIKGQYAASEALYLMIRHAMDDLGYRRMHWRCNAQNDKSRQAARRLGFRFEGVFYSHMIFKGKNRDTAWYSILDNEWPEVRGILEAWLDESNFNSDGSSKTSLYEMMQQRSAGQHE